MPRSFEEFMDHELPGRRDLIQYRTGQFLCRLDPEHEARAVAAIAERKLSAEANARMRAWIRLRNAEQFA